MAVRSLGPLWEGTQPTGRGKGRGPVGCRSGCTVALGRLEFLGYDLFFSYSVNICDQGSVQTWALCQADVFVVSRQAFKCCFEKIEIFSP